MLSFGILESLCWVIKISLEGKKNFKVFDWIEEKIYDMFELWGLKYDNFCSVFNKDRVKIWNDIFVVYKEKYLDSERILF